MSNVRVKICGLTNLQDAIYAADAGADYLGFVFWPHSKRAVAPSQVKQISAALRARPACPLLVGVFVNESAVHIARQLDHCSLDLAQLSGDEPPAMVGDPASPLYGRSYKALRPTSLAEAQADAEWYLPPEPAQGQPRLLLDANHPTLPGGSGVLADWSIAATLAHDMSGLMLAGGLSPENVRRAIHMVSPFAVDVASGVEAAPGQKDPARVFTFIDRARNA